MTTGIIALGVAVPLHQYQQDKIAELISEKLNLTPVEKRRLKSIYRATGIQHRYSVLSDAETMNYTATTAQRMQVYKDHACALAIQSVQHCFGQVNFDPGEITHLIIVSCTGMYAPGIDIELVQQLHLNTSIKRTAIHFMGCYAAFNALKVADAICQSEKNASVLIVAVELCTLHFQNKTQLDNLVSNAIFADGAAAALLQTRPTVNRYLSLESFHCDLLPQTSQDMTWQIADHGFDIVLASYIPEIIEKGITAFIQKLLAQQTFSQENIDFYAIHPGGVKILQACEKALGIERIHNRHAYGVLENYGNMSSATIFFVLRSILNEITHQDDRKNILGCAFGPGLTFESMLLNIHHH